MAMHNFQQFFKIIVAATAIAGLSSCGYFAKYDNRANALKLRTGMSKEEVLSLMGEPLRGKQYCRPDIWFYYVETKWAWDFQSTRDECLPIIFSDGKVAGWGVEYYKRNVLFPDSEQLSKDK